MNRTETQKGKEEFNPPRSAKITPKYLVPYLTKKCNARCPHCIWLLYDKKFFSNDEMPLESAKKILAHFRDRHKITHVIPVAEGEVLLYPHYRELIAFAKNIGYNSFNTVTTNGIDLGKYIDFILDSFQSLAISLDGYNAETNIQNRGGTEETFMQIINNIRDLVAQRNSKKLGFDITITSVVKKFTLNYIENIISLGEDLGVDRVRFVNYHPADEAEDSDWTPLQHGDQEVERYLKNIMNNTQYSVDVALPSLCGRNEPFECEMLFNGVQIGTKGDMSPCCRIPFDPVYGNIFADEEAYNSEGLQAFRKRFIDAGKREDLPAPCQKCPRLSPRAYSFSKARKTWTLNTRF